MRGEIDLKKCLACGDKITKGLFCAKHLTVVADGLRMANAPIDRTKLKAEAEVRHAAHQKAKKDAP